MPPRDTVAFSTVMLVAVLTVWLGIAGPLFTDAAAIGFWKWVNKWQTLVGAGLAIGAAYMAARPVWSQLKEMQMQNQHVRLEHLRTRSVELEREMASLYKVTSAVDLMARALFNMGPSTALPAGVDHIENLNRAIDAQTYMDNIIHRFID